jgi:ketol-acid reductoisomerase
MNRVISDTAEYGCYLFDHAARPLLADFMKKIDTNVIGKNFNDGINAHVENKELIEINEEIRYHDVEIVGEELREAMEAMEAIIK